jgi:hypothetical protein
VQKLAAAVAVWCDMGESEGECMYYFWVACRRACDVARAAACWSRTRMCTATRHTFTSRCPGDDPRPVSHHRAAFRPRHPKTGNTVHSTDIGRSGMCTFHNLFQAYKDKRARYAISNRHTSRPSPRQTCPSTSVTAPHTATC